MTHEEYIAATSLGTKALSGVPATNQRKRHETAQTPDPLGRGNPCRRPFPDPNHRGHCWVDPGQLRRTARIGGDGIDVALTSR